jgi:hypothetical protein
MSNITYDHNGKPIHGMFDPAETVLIEAAMQKDKDEITRLTKQRDELVAALEKIAAIEDKLFGGDWDEIEEAREFANQALAAVKETKEN